MISPVRDLLRFFLREGREHQVRKFSFPRDRFRFVHRLAQQLLMALDSLTELADDAGFGRVDAR